MNTIIVKDEKCFITRDKRLCKVCFCDGSARDCICHTIENDFKSFYDSLKDGWVKEMYDIRNIPKVKRKRRKIYKIPIVKV